MLVARIHACMLVVASVLAACLHLATPAAGASFGAPYVLGAGDFPHLDVSPDGTAVMGWRAEGAAERSWQVTIRGAAGAPRPPQTLERQTPGARTVAAGDGGTGASAWESYAGGSRRLLLSWATVAGGFGAPVTVADAPADDVDLALLPGGATLIAWVTAPEGALRATWCSAATRRCQAPVRLGTVAPGVQGQPVRVLASRQEVLVAWVGSEREVRLAALAPHSAPGAARRLNAGLPPAGQWAIRAATAPGGRAVVAWTDQAATGTPTNTRVVTREADGRIHGPVAVPLVGAQPVIGPVGDAVVLGEGGCSRFACPSVVAATGGTATPVHGFSELTPGFAHDRTAMDAEGLLVWAPQPAEYGGERAWIGLADGSAGRVEPLPTVQGSRIADSILDLDARGTGVLLGLFSNGSGDAGRIALVPYRSERGTMVRDPAAELRRLTLRRDRVAFRLSVPGSVRFRLAGGRTRPVTWTATARAGRNAAKVPRRAIRRAGRAGAFLRARPFDHLGRPGRPRTLRRLR